MTSLDAQLITSQFLHHQMQLNNTIQQAQVDVLKELTTSNYQRNFTTLLQAYLFLMEANRRFTLNG